MLRLAHGLVLVALTPQLSSSAHESHGRLLATLCSNECSLGYSGTAPNDGGCDDGGLDSKTNLCWYGYDCNDCGPRFEPDAPPSAATHYLPPFSPPSTPHLPPPTLAPPMLGLPPMPPPPEKKFGFLKFVLKLGLFQYYFPRQVEKVLTLYWFLLKLLPPDIISS